MRGRVLPSPGVRAVTLMALVALAAVAPAGAQTGAPEADTVKPLIAMLSVRGEGDTVAASGAAIIVGRRSNRLYLVTALHLAVPQGRPAKEVIVRLAFLPGESVRARVLEHIDRDLDLAVLSIVDTREFNEELDKLPYDRLATDSLKPRDRLYAMGNPEGQAWFSNVSPDRFRGVHNDLLEVESSTIRVGHSGGGLFNDGWLLVGMVSHVDPPVSRAVPIERILNRLRQWNYPVDLRPHRATSAGRPPVATPSPRTDAPPPAPAPRPAASTGNINLAYAGDQYSCRLLLDVSIGGRSFVPLANFFPVSNVPLGEQPYSISGRIDCPMVGSCIARGNGQIRVEEGSTFSVLWANSSYGTCDVHLLGPGSSLLR